MATSTGTVNIPIVARPPGGRDIEIGQLTLEVKIVSGHVKPPTARDIKAALRKGLR